jgi:hypothetical protein
MKINVSLCIVIVCSFVCGICFERGYVLAFFTNASAVLVNLLAAIRAAERGE